MTTLSLTEKEARAALLAKIAANYAQALRQAARAAESIGPDAELMGSDPVACREESLKSSLNEVRRIEHLLCEAFKIAGLPIPERKADRK